MKNTYLIVALLLLCCCAISQVTLPRLVRDSMILQRDAPLKIWGWASPGEKIKIVFNGSHAKATTGPEGKWMAHLPAMKAGGPYTMTISGKNSITLKDVLIGDVWFCSGQSNMVHQMALHGITYAKDIAEANYPDIRHFWIPTLTNLQGPQPDLPTGYWKWANPKDVNDFSAVAYFFARKLYEKYHVPIGLINASVGGTPIEAWASETGLNNFPPVLATIQKNKDTATTNRGNRAAFAGMGRKREETDKGLAADIKWYDPNYMPKGWQTINIPGYWEDQGARDLNGVVWYRREIDVPASMTGVPARVFLGRIVDADFLYINGVPVGNTSYQYPQRRYSVAAGVLKPGKNLFVVRVINTAGKGGFVPDKPYYLEAGGQAIDLKGYWQYKVGEAYPPFRGGFGGGGGGGMAQNKPTALYNAMVAPAINYTIKGFLWYQGETNAGNAPEYKRLLPALINDWRTKWGDDKLPFLYVQLPNFMDVQFQPSESNWAALREADLETLSVPNTGMAVAIDLGEWNDIHPDDKKDVGDRLALAAEKTAYGEKDIVASGPLYQSSQTGGNKIIVSFTSVGSGLIAIDGEPLSQFAIAGADKKFVWANAKIEGDKVVVWSDDVPQPLYVRYAWADNPFGANLYNKEKLPASPFQTSPIDSSKYPLPVVFTAQQDHDNMMQQLGIKKLRPGPSGDASAPNHANYEESLANPCPQLPDILTMKNGKKVTTADTWWKQRRPEIVEDFEKEVYGRVPAHVPKVSWTVKITDREFVGFTPVIAKELIGHVDNNAYPLINVDIHMMLVVPLNVKGPVPVLMMFGRPAFPAPSQPSPENMEKINAALKELLTKEHPELQAIFDQYPAYNPLARTGPAPFGPPAPGDPSPTEQLLAAGWGYATIDPNSIQADNGAGMTRGIIGLVNKGQPRKPDDWGALRAWAWGAARALDYLETDPLADAKKVGIEGISRYGKAALVTLAFEPRFAAGLIGSSGKGGATLHRRVYGEAVESLTGGEYYWMAGNYMKYGAAEAGFGSKTGCDLPVDSHELIALCAPRLTFISYGIPEKGDAHWLDHQGSYMATVAAGSVFKLLGTKDIGVSNDYLIEKMPPYNTGMLDGQLAWRQHDGGHTDAPNMKYFIPWAAKFLHYTKTPAQ